MGSIWRILEAQRSPLPGATVFTTDGRSARTGPDGGFRLVGSPPGDATYVAACPGYVTSAVVLAGARPDLHLRPVAEAEAEPPGGPLTPHTLRGQVFGPGGAAMADVLVLLGGAGVTGSIPVRTDDAGQFVSQVLAPAGPLGPISALAVEMHGEALGFAAQLEVGADEALSPAVTLAPATLGCTVEVDASAVSVPVQSELRAVAPDGGSLPLFARQGRLMAANLPGVRYELRATTLDPASEIESTLLRRAVALDWPQPSQVLREALLAPPTLDGPVPEASAGAWLGWRPVEGAGGYLVTINGENAHAGLPWEGFTTATRLPILIGASPLAPGPYAVTIAALDGPDLDSRALSSLQPRRLRRWAPAAGWRKAVRRFTLTR